MCSGSGDWFIILGSGDWFIILDSGDWFIILGSGDWFIILDSGDWFTRRPVDRKMSSALAEPDPVSADRSNWRDINVIWAI
jgi:hypothetical protein